MQLASRKRCIPAQMAGCQTQPELRWHFGHVWRGSASVAGSLDALHRAEGRDAHLHRMPRDFFGEELQGVPHCSGEHRSRDDNSTDSTSAVRASNRSTSRTSVGGATNISRTARTTSIRSPSKPNILRPRRLS